MGGGGFNLSGGVNFGMGGGGGRNLGLGNIPRSNTLPELRKLEGMYNPKMPETGKGGSRNYMAGVGLGATQGVRLQAAKIDNDFNLALMKLGIDARRMSLEEKLGMARIFVDRYRAKTERGAAAGNVALGLGNLKGAWDRMAAQMPTEEQMGAAQATMRTPLDFQTNVMRSGIFSPREVSNIASQAAKTVGQGMRSEQRQRTDRAAAMGYSMPWLGLSGAAGKSTVGGLQAIADAKFKALMANKQSQVDAAGAVGQLSQILAGLQATPTRPTGGSGFEGDYRQAMSRFQGMLGGIKGVYG
jgi:hypothetical protein